MKNMHFKLYASCILVKGISRTSLCDVQKGKIYFIPNDIAMLISNGEVTAEAISKNESLEKWMDILVKSNLGFLTKNPEYYPDLSHDWATPEVVAYAIIEMDTLTLYEVKNILTQLNELHCSYIEFRYYVNSDIGVLLDSIYLLKEGTMKGITVYVPFPSSSDLIPIYTLVTSTGLAREVIVHSVEDEFKPERELKRLSFVTQKINSNSHCGQISSNYFAINTKTFTESFKHNTCLNKKIAIDVEGNIKNCPSMTESYGHINNISLLNVIENPSFRKYWNITKDQTVGCKDCEFRRVCTDCRAYLENPSDLFSKPLKCGYNPLTTEWTEWSTNPLKEQAIEYYDLQF